MSTKNLARTILEAGRVGGWYKVKRREAQRKERTRARSYMARAGNSAELFDEEPMSVRRRERPPAADKLGAPRRWLRSQNGRPWAHVEAELLAKFSPRTLAGRHLVFDHLLREVRGYYEFGFVAAAGKFIFYVDAHGIFRAEQRTTRRNIAQA